MGALAGLLRPVSSDAFFADFHRRAPLVRRGDPLDVPDLLRCGDAIDSVDFDEDRRRIDRTSIDAELAAGRSVILNRVHEAWPPYRALAAELSRELGASVRMNLYLTPPHGYGFPVHADRHDVFIAQLRGVKRWLLYAPGGQTPIAAPETRPGDLLYLPTGFPHMAAGGPETSLHVTIGAHPS